MENINDDIKQWLKDQGQALFPDLFDDDNAEKQLDILSMNAWIANKKYKDSINDDELKQLLLFYTAHLMYQAQSGNESPSSVRLNDISVSYNKSSNDGTDTYLSQYQSMLHSLGFNQWGMDIS